MGVHDFALFVVAGFALNLTPGPDMAYIAARGANGGFCAGVAATLGITAGCVVHTLAAAAGLSALLATSATAFAIVKWCGAAYLLYAGVRLLASCSRATTLRRRRRRRSRRRMAPGSSARPSSSTCSTRRSRSSSLRSCRSSLTRRAVEGAGVHRVGLRVQLQQPVRQHADRVARRTGRAKRAGDGCGETLAVRRRRRAVRQPGGAARTDRADVSEERGESCPSSKA